ncbi:MAG TPA: divalent-cation tolerance protein CutA [Stellaceae bacterium]|nr:divalent-cation tolerance protein CutA [Stellaceae bacterium]
MFVYVTAGDAEEARRIGCAVVEARLAACANVIAGMRSVYWWQGKVTEGEEAVLILKTTGERLDALMARVKELHSYDCPCIEALPVVAGHQPFLDWVVQETQERAAEDNDSDGLSDGG